MVRIFCFLLHRYKIKTIQNQNEKISFQNSLEIDEKGFMKPYSARQKHIFILLWRKNLS